MTFEQREIAVDALLMALILAEARYTYETILQKRVLEGASASGTCELCEENVNEGWIDSEDVYPSGDDGPPFHPHCVCTEEYKEKRVRVYT